MRRWDLYGGAAALLVSVLDLALFAWGGLDVGALLESAPGWIVLIGFVLGYAGLGYLAGRVWMARQRTRRDAARIAAQLEALEESRARLVQSEKLAALGRLAAGIAHEVRNPLGVIRASASMVQESFAGDTDDHRACELIKDEIDRLDGLIGALLAFAKPARLKMRSTSLESVVRRASTLASEGRELRVEADVAPALELRADGDLLTQVLLGLCVNAAEAGASTVAVRASRDGASVRIEVADDGPGVAREDVPRIFEPFFTTKDTGTGLGLSMALRIVEAHGGALELTEGGLGEGGRGACFRVRLPVDGPAHLAEAA